MNKQNILLFAGTAETKDLCRKIIAENHHLTVSTISNDNLDIPESRLISRIIGKMNKTEIIHYLQTNDFSTVICAVHPYAETVRNNIIAACKLLKIRLLIYIRDESAIISPASNNIIYSDNHQDAANILNQSTGNILLTTGSNNLQPYMDIISQSRERVFARVLNTTSSAAALQNSGIKPDHSFFGRGPFTVTANISLIRKYHIKFLVTKDGGTQGGTPEKIQAASETDCKVILIKRPQTPETYYTSISQIIELL